jgi:hypothetical protein
VNTETRTEAVGICPAWCVDQHATGEHPVDQHHWSAATILTTGRQVTLRQHIGATRPTVVITDPVTGVDLDLRPNEALELAAALIDAIRVAAEEVPR